MKNLIVFTLTILFASICWGESLQTLQKNADFECQKRLGTNWAAFGVDAQFFPHGSACRIKAKDGITWQADDKGFSAVAPTTAPTIYLGDQGADNDFVFSSAFASEPACSGLSAMGYANHTEKERWSALNSKWEVFYSEVTNPFGKDYSVTRIYHNHRHVATFYSPNATTAARRACFIVQGRGGKVQ